MFAYGLSLLVLQAVPQLVLWIGLLVLFGSQGQHDFNMGQFIIPAGSVPWVSNAPFDIIVFWIILITGFSIASKLPGQIQYMLMGDKEKSR